MLIHPLQAEEFMNLYCGWKDRKKYGKSSSIRKAANDAF